jgi:hypothetical protein
MPTEPECDERCALLYNKDLPGSNALPCSQFVTDNDQDCGLHI